MSMMPPDLWLDLTRARHAELARRGPHSREARARRRAGVRTRVAAAVRVLLARSETVAEVRQLVVAAARPDRERECA